jgi:predicted patatin/cPLA2 family phospholipase
VTTAFVLSGGGSLGAVQVGILQALVERGVSPDLLIGTSAGALNLHHHRHHDAEKIDSDGCVDRVPCTAELSA